MKTVKTKTKTASASIMKNLPISILETVRSSLNASGTKHRITYLKDTSLSVRQNATHFVVYPK